MKSLLLFLLAAMSFAGCAKPSKDGTPDSAPLRIPVALPETLFSRAEVIEGILHLELKANRLVKDGGEPRIVRKGEKIELKPGIKVLLAEHHSSTEIVYSPAEGLLIDARFDARSFGGGVEIKHYLLKAENEK